MVEITAKVGPKGQIVIPKPFRDELDLPPGSEVVVRDEPGMLIIRKKKQADWLAIMEHVAKSDGGRKQTREARERTQ